MNPEIRWIPFNLGFPARFQWKICFWEITLRPDSNLNLIMKLPMFNSMPPSIGGPGAFQCFRDFLSLFPSGAPRSRFVQP